jgi:superfamily II DNA or RNA helicase
VTLDLLSWTPATDPRNPRNAHPRNETPATDELRGAQVIAGGVRNNPPHTPPDPHCGGGVENKGCDPARLEGPQSGRDCGGTPTAGTPCGPRPTGENSAAHCAPTLRPYQTQAIEAIEARYTEGDRSTLLVLPTGTGKTVVFAELARRYVRRGHRALVLAHRGELLDQAFAKLAEVGVRASIEQGQRIASQRSEVVVASVQTLRGDRLAKYAPDEFDFVVVDEAHHAAAASYKAILDRFSSAHILGVTATPDRADGRALRGVFASVAFKYEMRRAIADGFLAPIRARRVRVTDVDLSAIKAHHGDLDQGELSTILRDEKALQGVVGPLIHLAGRRKTVVFGVDVAHAHAIADRLNSHRQGCAIALDGTASDVERRAITSLFRQGAFQYLVNCALFTEGFDEPSIECVALARPTLSRGLYTQMLGRGTRLSPGKADCLVLDFVGNSSRHTLIGPADALAGRELTAEERAQIDKQLGSTKQADLELVLAEAEEKTAAKRAQVSTVALAHFRTTEVDVWLGAFMAKLDPDSPAGREPATEAQLSALEKKGIAKPPNGITKGEASAMLDAIVAREKAGLATIPQARLLATRLGIDVAGMTKQRATQLILKAKASGFRPWSLQGEREYRGKKS